VAWLCVFGLALAKALNKLEPSRLRGTAFVAAAAGLAEVWVEGCDESGVVLDEVVVVFERDLAAVFVDGKIDFAGCASDFEVVEVCGGG